MEQVSANKCFDGQVKFFKHQSSSVKTEMTFSVFHSTSGGIRSGTGSLLFIRSYLHCRKLHIQSRGL